jgi:quinol monooxygenase YgiN
LDLPVGEHEFSKIPTISAKIRTSPYADLHFTDSCEQSQNVNKPDTNQLLIVCRVGTSSTQEEQSIEAIGLLVTLEARAGKEADAEAFLKSAQPLGLDEKGTLKSYAIKLGSGKFGIFDTFANEAGRNAHLTGEIAKTLTARANELFAIPPQVQKVEVLANTPLKG